MNIAGELVKVARELVGASLGRKWVSQGPMVVVYWSIEIESGILPNIQKAFSEVERVAEREWGLLSLRILGGRGVVKPLARLYAVKDRAYVGASLSFMKRDERVAKDYHVVLMDWERSGKVG